MTGDVSGNRNNLRDHIQRQVLELNAARKIKNRRYYVMLYNIIRFMWHMLSSLKSIIVLPNMTVHYYIVVSRNINTRLSVVIARSNLLHNIFGELLICEKEKSVNFGV